MVARRTTLLTSKQQQFVEAYVSGKSASDAYRLAYDVLNMSSTSINKEASRLIARPQIRALIEELQEDSRVATTQALIASKQEVLMRLTRYMRAAEPGDSTRLRAAELMGKHYGLFTEVVTIEPAPRTSAMIRAELIKRLEAISPQSRSQLSHNGVTKTA